MDTGDLDSLHEMLSDPSVMRFLEPPFTREKTIQFLESAGLSDPPLIYAVEDGGIFIGYVIYHDYDADSKEIGWVLKKESWGRGYAKELTHKLISQAKAEGKAVILECSPQQLASKHIAETCGFSYFGLVDGCELYRIK